MRWSDTFTLRSCERASRVGWHKTTGEDRMIWDGFFAGQPIVVFSTVRLTGGNHDHFCVSSNARIGENAWSLRGGHYVDLRVICKHPLNPDEMLALGQLARTEEDRAVTVRQGKQTLSESITVPMS